MFGTQIDIDASEKREGRIESLSEALDLLGDAAVLVAADLDVLYQARPGPVALENGTWDFQDEQQLSGDLRSVMDRIAGIVYRLERERAAERRGGVRITPHAA